MSAPSWQLDPNVHPMTVGTFLDCVMDLGSAAEGLLDKKSLFDTDGGWRVLQAVVRRISVPLRKLLLDDEGALLKKAIDGPAFPPLGGKKGQYRRATISWHSERRECVFGYADGKRETVVVPETKHEIEIGRLYGVDFLEDGWCAIHSPFDLMARPAPMDAWLGLPCTHIQGWTNQLPPCSVTAWSTRTRYYRPFVRLSRKLASSGLWHRRR